MWSCKTASTMAILTEVLGLMVPSGACAPAHHLKKNSRKNRIESIRIAKSNYAPKNCLFKILKMSCNSAIGGSTNGLIHLIAIAGRLGFKIDLKKFDELTKIFQ